VALGVSLLCASAAAAPPKVVALAPRFAPKVAQGARKVLDQRLAHGLQAAGAQVVSGRVVREAVQGACDGAACWRKVGQLFGARYVAGASVAGEERFFELKLWLADARGGRVVARVERRCDICGLKAVADAMDLAASALLAKLRARAARPARIAVVSEPPGATVFVDGKAAGRAPAELSLAAGRHALRVESDGYLPAQRVVQAVAGGLDKLRFRLLRRPPVERSGPRWQPIVGWGAVGLGVATLAAGVTLLALDGGDVDCRSGVVLAREICSRRDTTVGGWILTASGVALAAGGAAVLLLAPGRRARESASRGLSSPLAFDF